MTKEQLKLLEDLAHTGYGQVLKTYLDEELKDLKDVTKAKTWEEALGNGKAVKIIEKLFSFMKDNKPAPKKKNQYI